MNYKFYDDYIKFDILEDIDNRLIAFFSLHKYRVAYIFEQDVLLGYITYDIFLKNNLKFDKNLLKQDYIIDFNDYIKDHKILITYFNKTGNSCGLIVNNGTIIGEMRLIRDYDSSFKSKMKQRAFKLFNVYKDEIREYLKHEKYNNVGIILNNDENVINDLLITNINCMEAFDIVIDTYIDDKMLKIINSKKIVAADDFLFNVIMLQYSKKEEIKKSLFFFDSIKDDKINLTEQDSERIIYSGLNSKKVLSNDEYYDLLYKNYPLDVTYLKLIKNDFIRSVIIGDNGVYFYVKESVVKNDFKDCRITPSNNMSCNSINFFGPCTTYGLFTSKYNTIEEQVKKILINKRIDFDCYNYGVPIGASPLNDLFVFMYLPSIDSSINVFINEYSDYVKKFLLKEHFNYYDPNESFKNVNSFFLDIPMHFNAKGNGIFAKFICDCICIKNRYLGKNLIDLQKIKLNRSHYLVEDSLEKYINYLRNNKTDAKGKIGMIQINASPLTNGHTYLIDYSATHCDFLYIFVVEDNRNALPFFDRFMLIKDYSKKYSNCVVLTGGSVLGSKHTLTAYFNKQYDMDIDTSEDIKNFKNIIMPELDIDIRFMGEEPDSPLTNKINEGYKEFMHSINKELIEIPRLMINNDIVSASKIRKALTKKDFEYIKSRVPSNTYNYLLELTTDEYTIG